MSVCVDSTVSLVVVWSDRVINQKLVENATMPGEQMNEWILKQCDVIKYLALMVQTIRANIQCSTEYKYSKELQHTTFNYNKFCSGLNLFLHFSPTQFCCFAAFAELFVVYCLIC